MRRLFALLLLLVSTGASAQVGDWRTHAIESEAGWTFGKPGAPLLVEYASFGCPHCGEFSGEAGPAIADKVRSGKLRYAFRPFLIFPHDRAATVLARCVPAPKRFAFIKAVMTAQPATRAALAELDRSDQSRQALFEAELKGPEVQALLLGRATGLAALAAGHGLPAAAAEACLASTEQHVWAGNADLAGRVAGVTGTPTFLWKGQRLGKDLTPKALVAALPR